MSTLGERLRKARKRRGMSQMDVFDALGISNKSLSRYEKDVSAPSPEVLMKLSRLYDVSSEYLLGLSTAMEPSSDAGSAEDSLIEMNDQRGSAEKLIKFISDCPTAFHAAENIAQKLSNEGFAQLNEWEDWNVSPGGKYFVVRNGSSVIAFKVGSEPEGFNIFSAHGDSPMFKLKPDFEMEAAGSYVVLNTEKYGGGIISTWFDRPLSLAGRLVINTRDGIKTANVDLSALTLVIPNTPPHLNKGLNDGYTYNLQHDTLPLLGSLASKGSVMKAAAEQAGVRQKDILSAELYLYNKMPGAVWGDSGEFVSSPRLDDMQCVYAGLRGFLSGGSPKRVAMLCVFDNEEVGSSTKQGANSDFLTSVFERVCRSLGLDKNRAEALSFCVSADNAHAVHPNHPELSDPVNAPKPNGGIVIKQTARQSYATDALSDGIFRKICLAAGVPVQAYSNRSDIPGGGTLGNISATRLSVPTVDIGLAQLAMHSCYETAGSMDTLYLERAAAELMRTEIKLTPDGGVRVG